MMTSPRLWTREGDVDRQSVEWCNDNLLRSLTMMVW